MSKIKKGDTVRTAYLAPPNNTYLEGEVTKTRKHHSNYNIQVRWIGYVDLMWYQEDELVKL